MDSAVGGRRLPRRFLIGDWEVDQLQGIIQKGDLIARVRPLAMRLLVCIAQRAPEPSSINDLVHEIWSPRVVGDDAVYAAVSELRKKLGDDARRPVYIETLPKRGVRVIAAVKDPIEIPELPEQEQDTDSERSASSRLPPFVGRGSILSNLESCMNSAMRRRGRVVFIAGEPGVGKTRTAQEFADRAEARDVKVYYGWCDGSLVSPPYWPWTRLLRTMLDDLPSSNLKERLGTNACAVLATILPELRSTHPDLPSAPEVSPELLAFELAQAIWRVANNLSEPHSLLLVLDDVHRADERTLAVLYLFAKEISKSRVVLICTYRDVEVDERHPLTRVLSHLSRVGHYDRIQLSGLVREDVKRLLSQYTEGANDLTDSIMAATDGNSLFVTEIIRAIAVGPKPWDKRDLAILLPRSLSEVILGRLQDLSPDCRRAVDIASVIGLEFPPEVMESVGNFDVDAVDRSVDEALKSGVFAPAPDGGLRFSHALIKDAIYETLPRRSRRDLHRAIAEAMSVSFDSNHESAGHPEAIAFHFQEAGLLGEAIDYWEKAANVALLRSAHSEQIRRLQQALQSLSMIKRAQPHAGAEPDPLDRREIRFRLALGNAHMLIDGASAALSAPEFSRVLELCNARVNAPELDLPRFMAVNGLWGYHAMRCDTHETRELAQLQSDLAERAGSDAYRLAAGTSQAIIRFFEGDFARSLEVLEVATQRYAAALAKRIAKGTSGPWRTNGLLSPVYYAWCLALVGRANEAQDLAERSVAEASQLGTHAHVQALTYLAAILEATRDVHRARAVSEQILDLAEKFGYSSWLGAMGHCTRGWTRSCLGETADGLAEVQRGFESYRAVGATLALTHRISYLAEAMLRAERVDDAIRLIDETLAAGHGRIEHVFDAELMRIRGECNLVRGDTEDGMTWFRRARELARSQGSPLFELRAACALMHCRNSDKQLASRIRELKRQLGGGIGRQDQEDATRALDAARN